MSGSFLPSSWFSTNHSLLGSQEPALLCNHVPIREFLMSGNATYQDLDLVFHLGRVQRGVPLTDWFDDFVKDFVHDVTHTALECFVFSGEVLCSTERIASSISPL